MSGVERQSCAALSADELDLQAARWIERRDCSGWGTADQIAFDTWMNISSAHRVAFLRLDSGWRSAERLAALRAEPHDFLQSSGRMVSMIGKTAAVLAGFAVLCAAAIYMLVPGYKIYATAIGGHETLTLHDGSRIELNTDTVVRVAGDGRKVLLERGEAYFDVVHDNSHPFTVVTGDSRVTDIGTKFSIRRNPDHLEVILYEGRARFDEKYPAATAQAATLMPGDVVTASASGMTVVHRSGTELSKALGWRRGVLVFDDTPLADAAAELNRYNSKKVVIADSAVEKIGIGGTFATNNIAGFAHIAQNILHLHVETRGDEIVIAR